MTVSPTDSVKPLHRPYVYHLEVYRLRSRNGRIGQGRHQVVEERQGEARFKLDGSNEKDQTLMSCVGKWKLPRANLIRSGHRCRWWRRGKRSPDCNHLTFICPPPPDSHPEWSYPQGTIVRPRLNMQSARVGVCDSVVSRPCTRQREGEGCVQREYRLTVPKS